MDAVVYVWLAAALIFLILEIASPMLIFACFVVGSLAGAGTSLLTDSYLIQGIVFAVVSLALIPATRPLVGKITKPSPVISNVDGLIGRTAIVTVKVTPISGKVLVDGQVWQARAEGEIEIDRKVKVLTVEGAKLNVEEIV